jgi:hypothetical protein
VVRNGLPKTRDLVLLDLLLCTNTQNTGAAGRVRLDGLLEEKLGCSVMQCCVLQGGPGQEELRRAPGDVDDYASTYDIYMEGRYWEGGWCWR